MTGELKVHVICGTLINKKSASRYSRQPERDQTRKWRRSTEKLSSDTRGIFSFAVSILLRSSRTIKTATEITQLLDEDARLYRYASVAS